MGSGEIKICYCLLFCIFVVMERLFDQIEMDGGMKFKLGVLHFTLD